MVATFLISGGNRADSGASTEQRRNIFFELSLRHAAPSSESRPPVPYLKKTSVLGPARLFYWGVLRARVFPARRTARKALGHFELLYHPRLAA